MQEKPWSVLEAHTSFLLSRAPLGKLHQKLVIEVKVQVMRIELGMSQRCLRILGDTLRERFSGIGQLWVMKFMHHLHNYHYLGHVFRVPLLRKYFSPIALWIVAWIQSYPLLPIIGYLSVFQNTQYQAAFHLLPWANDVLMTAYIWYCAVLDIQNLFLWKWAPFCPEYQFFLTRMSHFEQLFVSNIESHKNYL